MTTSSSTILFLFAVGLNLTICLQETLPVLNTEKQWKLFDWKFLPNAPADDINFYNPNNILATGIAIGFNRIFIATPKLFSGVPSTVNFVSKSDFGDSSKLQAYPDWSFSTTGRKDFNCSDLVLISVYRMRIDSCNRLWVLDAGVSRSLEDYEITCPPKLLVIDLNTDHVVRRIDFPNEILRGESLFTNLVVDETTANAGTCDDVFVYISDTVEPGIVVYDSERDVTWRLSHPSMYPDPDFAQSKILNHQFILMDGVVGLAFDEKIGVIYFQPLATDRIFSVTKDTLRAGPLAQNQLLDVKLVGKKSSQGIGLAVSPFDSSLLFSPLSETAIASWNPTTNQQSVLSYDPERLQFVADITTSRFEEGVIYMVSSKFHRFFLKNLDSNEVNNRILSVQLFDPTRNSPHFSSVKQVNSLAKQITEKFNSPSSKYFVNKLPYIYEPVGVIKYSVNNPFSILNQGESLPNIKEYAGNEHVSFLDNLTAQKSISTDVRLKNGFFYTTSFRGGESKDNIKNVY